MIGPNAPASPVEEEPRTPARLLSVAAFILTGAFLLMISLTGCTIGATRLGFAASIAADGATTASAIGGGAHEANPVLGKNAMPVMGALAAIVVIAAEHEIKDGNQAAGKRLYWIATAVHTAAAAWNTVQMSQHGSSASSGSTTTAVAAARR